MESKDVWIEGLCWSSFSQMAGGFTDVNYDPKNDALVLYIHEQYGRFGNNIIQILNALIVAKHLSINQILCKFYIDARQTKSIIIDDISIAFGCLQAPRAPCLSATMFYLQGFEKIIQEFSFDSAKHNAERVFRALFKSENNLMTIRAAQRIAFHFRSGDIFSTNRNPIYTQPPLSYYVTALDHICSTMDNFEIYLVYEDELNPCIDKFRAVLTAKSLPFAQQSANFDEDAVLMATADCIVASYSSFCDVLALMNCNLKRWYSFRSIGAYEGIDLSISKKFSGILLNDGTQVYIVEDTKGSYIPLGKWTYSDEQKDELLRYPASNLEIKQIKYTDRRRLGSRESDMAFI